MDLSSGWHWYLSPFFHLILTFAKYKASIFCSRLPYTLKTHDKTISSPHHSQTLLLPLASSLSFSFPARPLTSPFFPLFFLCMRYVALLFHPRKRCLGSHTATVPSHAAPAVAFPLHCFCLHSPFVPCGHSSPCAICFHVPYSSEVIYRPGMEGFVFPSFWFRWY